MGNTFGYLFKLTTFGESHGIGVGGVVDGMPSGIDIDTQFVQNELNRRRPGQSNITTMRKETDQIEWLSGIFEGKSTGAPIAFIVRNNDHHSSDYNNIKDLFRPSHADFTYQEKYGIRDYRGGGRSSARITIARVVGGALAKLVLRKLGITIQAYTSQVGDIRVSKPYTELDLKQAEDNVVRCPEADTALKMEQLITQMKTEGDTIGGVITCVAKGCPVGLGEPEAQKLQAMLGAAMLSINAAKGFEYGLGFEGVGKRGSEVNDVMQHTSEGIHTLTNNSGGIQGGISNGEDIFFRVAFKPVATILRKQNTIDIHGNNVSMKANGRHDPCVLPRAVPIVEAMTAMVILDAWMINRAKQSPIR